MSCSLNVVVPLKKEDSSKLTKAIWDFNQEAKESTGETEFDFVEVDNIKNLENVTEYNLSGDPYDLGALMIRLYTQNVWMGGQVLLNKGLPLWDGTYNPQREVDVENFNLNLQTPQTEDFV